MATTEPLLPRFERSASYPFVKRLCRSLASTPTSSSPPSSPMHGSRGKKKSLLERTTRMVCSRKFLCAMVCLYALACVIFPGAIRIIPLPSALRDGFIEYSFLSSGPSLDKRLGGANAHLLVSRRMTMEYRQDVALFNHEGTPIKMPFVTYKEHGTVIPLIHALNASLWHGQSLYSITDPDLDDQDKSKSSKLGLQMLAGTSSFDHEIPDDCPQGPVRVFIGITSRSGTTSAMGKRDAIRKSWLDTVKKDYSDTIQASFVLSQQQSDDAAINDGTSTDSVARTARLIADEVRKHQDIVILPGLERYLELPAKTFALLDYAMSSPCRFTHVVKTDDDVFLRPHKLLDIIFNGEREYTIPFYYTGSVNATAAERAGHHDLAQWREAKHLNSTGERFSVIRAANYTVEDHEWSSMIDFDGIMDEPVPKPWMTNMYVGKLDSNKTACFPGCEGVFPGWEPNRTATSKWYLPHSMLSDEEAAEAMSVRWLSGWGYMMSRDMAELVLADARRFSSSASSTDRPAWWGKLPWEDTVVAALLAMHNGTEASYHTGFKAAWDGCGPDTVLKHLDNDAPLLTEGLDVQQKNGLWSINSVTCSTGPHEPGDYDVWRKWRNSLPDNIAGGFM